MDKFTIVALPKERVYGLINKLYVLEEITKEELENIIEDLEPSKYHNDETLKKLKRVVSYEI